MSNLLHIRSHVGRALDKGAASPSGDKDQTVFCGLFPWKIPRVRLGSFFHSLQGRLRGQERTLVTALNVQQSPVDQGGDQKQTACSRRWSLFRKPNKVQPIEKLAFGGSSEAFQWPVGGGTLPQDKSSSHKTRSVTSSSSDVTPRGSFCLPGAVEETEVVFLQDISRGSPLRSSSHGNTSVEGNGNSLHSRDSEAKTPYFHRPKYLCESSSDREVHHHFANVLDSNEFAIDAVMSENLDKAGHMDDLSGSIETDHVPASSCTDNDDGKLSVQEQSHIASDNEGDVEIDTVQNGTNEPLGAETSSQGVSVGLDHNQDIEKCHDVPSSNNGQLQENLLAKAEDEDKQIEVFEDPAEEHDDELEKELDFYEDNDAEGDDDVDIDRILRNCPPTEVLQNLRDMVQQSRNMTNQLERALRKAARISCGPFPRLPGLSKDEVIDKKCCKLVEETEEFVGTINKNFMTFYQVVDRMDKVAAEQDSYVSSILVKRGPRDWRRKHAAIVRRMENMWSRVYPKVITRKQTESTLQPISELDEESEL